MLLGIHGVNSLRIATAYAGPGTATFLNRFEDIPKIILLDYDPRFLIEKTVRDVCAVNECTLYFADIEPLFHPKVYLLRTDEALHVLIGSNNATHRGLNRNVEVATLFVFSEGTDDAEIAAVEDLWLRLTEIASTHVTDDLINERKAEFAEKPEQKPGSRHQRPTRNVGVETPEVVVERPPAQQGILIAELPGGERWTQATFNTEVYQHFFLSQNAILLTARQLGEPTGLQAPARVVVKGSSNYCVEIQAPVGIDFDAARRPIVVFMRKETSVFSYSLFVPEREHYDRAADILTRWSGPPRNGNIRRYQADPNQLRAEWPELADTLA
jgi:hypothetical protein